jgi:chromosome segregation ATPase
LDYYTTHKLLKGQKSIKKDIKRMATQIEQEAADIELIKTKFANLDKALADSQAQVKALTDQNALLNTRDAVDRAAADALQIEVDKVKADAVTSAAQVVADNAPIVAALDALAAPVVETPPVPQVVG